MGVERLRSPYALAKMGGGAGVLALAAWYLFENSKPKGKRKASKRDGRSSVVSKKQATVYFKKLLKDLYRRGGMRLLIIALVAVVRTALQNYQGRLQGRLFQTAFLKQQREFLRLLLENVGVCIATSIVESSSSFLLTQLSTRWREVLTQRLHKKYFANMAYYQMSYVDHRIPDPEATLCEDSARLCTGLADVSGEVLKSTVDAIFYCIRLRQYTHTNAYTGALASYIVVAGLLTQLLAPNFSKLVRTTQELEGAYKDAHMRLRERAEPITLLRGTGREAGGVRQAFKQIIAQANRLLGAQLVSGVTTDFFLKYLGATAAVVLIIGPFFTGRLRPDNTTVARAHMLSEMRYHTSVIIGLFAAFGTIAMTPRKWAKLHGYAQRLCAMETVMDEVHASAGERAVLAASSASSTALLATSASTPALPTASDAASGTALTAPGGGADGAVHRVGSRVAADREEIEFAKVTLETPTGSTLVRDLCVRVPAGTNLLVTGPNGSGKSSLFRALGGLWPIKAGVIRKPDAAEDGLSHHIFYVPQRPYVMFGSLLEQLVYPLPVGEHTHHSTGAAHAALKDVGLEHLLDRHGLYEQVQWNEELSLGEQQRLGIARLVYHRPRFAVLDECTSGVTMDMERRFTQILKRLGCTCITISHRPALVAFHDLVLALDGEGGWSLQHRQREASAELDAGGEDCAASGEGRLQRAVVRSVLRQRGMESVHECMESMHSGLMADRLQGVKADDTEWGQWKRVVGVLFAQMNRMTLLNKLGSIGLMVGLRTLLQDRIARLNGRTVEYVLAQDRTGFLQLIWVSVAQSLGSAILAPLLRYATDALALAWRQRLTEAVTRAYLRGNTVCTTLQLAGMADADQRVTRDVEQLSAELSQLLPTFVKPVFDILWFSWQMGRLTGRQGVGMLYGYMAVGFLALHVLTPDFATRTARMSALESAFRKAHHYLKQHAESVAFFGGARREGQTLDGHLGRLLKHSKELASTRWLHSIVDDLFTKQLPHNATWALTMLYALRRPEDSWGTVAEQGEAVFHMRYLATIVANCFLAFGEMLKMHTRLHELTGGVSRVSQLLSVSEHAARLQQEMADTNVMPDASGNDNQLLKLDSVCVVTPSGHTLVKHASLSVHRRRNLLVTGPNGSGKSSIVRLLAGLWPSVRGTIVAPGGSQHWNKCSTIFYVPQQPYVGSSTLLEEVLYPLSMADALEARGHPRGQIVGRSGALAALESECMELMGVVRLEYLIAREGGWRTSKPWATVLSLGEQQRLGMARLYYHRPELAVLDECTNATSIDIEQQLYEHAAKLDITVITISQRPALTRHHALELKLLDGSGHWELCELVHSDEDGHNGCHERVSE